MSETYPRDDFDGVPEGNPVGVHRRTRNPWAPVVPFLLVLVLVPLLAWGVATLIQRNVPEAEVGAAQSQSQPQSQQVQPTTDQAQSDVVIPDSNVPTAAPDDPGATPDEPAEPTEPEGTVDFAAAVTVLNGTTISGYAAEFAGYVTNAGFTNVTATNASTWPTDQNTVFYPSAELRATAEAVAAAAGIANVVEGGFEEAPGSVVVFLIN